MDFSYVHIRYFIGYVYHICLQDTIQSTLSLCLLCQAMLLPMPLRPLLLTTRSGFSVWCCTCVPCVGGTLWLLCLLRLVRASTAIPLGCLVPLGLLLLFLCHTLRCLR